MSTTSIIKGGLADVEPCGSTVGPESRSRVEKRGVGLFLLLLRSYVHEKRFNRLQAPLFSSSVPHLRVQCKPVALQTPRG
jgi:hypothetical protein